MVGVGLGSVAVVMVLAFLSFLAVWYVIIFSLFLRNERIGGRMGSRRRAGMEEGQGIREEAVLGTADTQQAKGTGNSAP